MGMQGVFCFLKDWFLTSMIYGSTLFCVVLFYQLSSKEPIELAYPVMIGLTGYGLIVIFEGVKYVRFYRRLETSVHNPQYQLCPTTLLQMKSSETIQKIHRSYIQQINEIKMSNEQQNRFLSQWVHNLKSPITVIDLLAQPEPEQPSISKPYEVLVSISEENQILNHRVEQLLSLIRLGEFARDFQPESIYLAEEVRLLINNLKKQFIVNHVFPELKIETENAIVFSDRKWNGIMVEQFLTNAIKYSQSTENKKVFITLTQNAEQIILIIRDEGIGIPEYDLTRIFEPFFTGDNGRSHKNATGIGLYIANLIAGKLNHLIEVSSVMGEGTTVKIVYSLSKSV